MKNEIVILTDCDVNIFTFIISPLHPHSEQS